MYDRDSRAEHDYHPCRVEGAKIPFLALHEPVVDLFDFSLLPGHHSQPRAIYEPLYRPSWVRKYVMKHVCVIADGRS